MLGFFPNVGEIVMFFSVQTTKTKLVYLFVCLCIMVLRFELRASLLLGLLGRHCTT
jgi:hypothetical protein